MPDVLINDADFRIDTIRYPDNSTNFIVGTPDATLGMFALHLMPSIDAPAFIIGQAVVPGTESHYEGMTTRIVKGRPYVVNCVYQLHLVEREVRGAKATVDNSVAGDLLMHAVANYSGYKGDVDTLVVLAAGVIQVKQVGDELHYMVGDVVFSKAHAPQ